MDEWRNLKMDLWADINQTTYIVVSSDCVPRELGTAPRIIYQNLPLLWVWAYDADWNPPSPNRTTDDDGYDGRLKVPINRLFTWFYAARVENVDMKDMWRKAQKHPDKLWTCETLFLEDWVHEPFV